MRKEEQLAKEQQVKANIHAVNLEFKHKVKEINDKFNSMDEKVDHAK